MLLDPLKIAGHALVGRQDLPIPEWLFAWGASLVLIVSFIGLSVAWHTTRFEQDSWRPAPGWLDRLVVNPLTRILAGAIGVALFVLTIYTGLNGTPDPNLNFAVPFVFVTFWLGLVVLSVFFGDVFRAFNPWRAVAEVVSSAFTLAARQPAPAPLRYPEKLGRWPAVAGILAFAWFELSYATGFSTVGLDPADVAIATLVYSAWTFVGMALFGINVWLERGEAFSVYFSMFASLSPFEVRDGRLGLRRVLSGSTRWVTHPGSVAMILAIIGATAFDGAQEGALGGIHSFLFDSGRDAGLSDLTAYRLAGSILMLACVAAVNGIFWLGIRGMHTVKGSRPTSELVRLFAHSFIPIALAYLIAHYLTLFLYLEQAQFTYLLSDPLGEGSNLFGTAEGGIDYTVLGAEIVWYIQVGALLVGHVTALVLGHDRALAIYGDSKSAARSQYWMLALMVGFTSLGLFLLSQANS